MRRALDVAFQAFALVVLCLALASLGALIWDVWRDGSGRLSWDFLTGFPSRRADVAGIWHALTGSIYVILVTGALAVPVGVAAAIYLEEYGSSRTLVSRLIEINITNLAAVPSIIYGLLGLGLFVRALGLGRSVLAGGATLALLVLPVVILSTREALRAVPKSLREGSVRPRRHQVADDLVPGLAGRDAGHPDGAHPGAVARDWRDGPVDYNWRRDVRDLRAGWHLVAVHGHADPDLQLGLAAAGRLPGERRGRHHRAARAAADDERDGHRAARPLPEEGAVVSTPARVPSLAGVAARKDAGTPRVDRPAKIEAESLNFFYGDKRALEDISVKIQPHLVTAFIGPSGCGKSTFLRTLNRMNDIIPGARVEGRVLIDGSNIYDPGVDVVELRRRVGMVFQKSNPFPKSIFENIAYGLRINAMARSRSELAERVEESLVQAALWDEVKDRLTRIGAGHVRRPAAAAVHRTGAGGAAGYPPDGRARVGARPDRDAAHRGTDLRPEEGVHHRHRDPQHAAGGTGVRPDGLLLARASCRVRSHR